jgi:hypothetical protein
VQVVQCDDEARTGNELSKQGTASKALMEVYGSEFTKETKSEVTVVFTSVLYTSILNSSHSIVRRRVSNLGMHQKVLEVMTCRLQKRLSQTDKN